MRTKRRSSGPGSPRCWRQSVAAAQLALVAFCLPACTNTTAGDSRTTTGTRADEPRLANQRYEDRNGYFSIIPPDGWKIETYPGDPRGKVAFHGPDDAELRVLVSTLDYSDFDRMLAIYQQKKRQLSGMIEMDLETTRFQNRKAIKKTFSHRGTKFLSYDFLIKNVHHDVQYGAADSVFERHLPLIKLSMETYEPVLRDQPPEETKRSAVAKRLRLARIFLDNGQLRLARQMIQEGLDFDPGNEELLRMRQELPQD